MVAVSETMARHRMLRGAAMVLVVLPMALLAGCAQQPPPPQPAPVQAAPPPAPPPTPAPVPPARG
jgi:hypothetical protein